MDVKNRGLTFPITFLISFEQFGRSRVKQDGFRGVLDISTSPGNYNNEDVP